MIEKDITVLVINTNDNEPLINKTLNSISLNLPDCKKEVVSTSNCKTGIICGESLSSLVDVGIQNVKTKWAFFVNAGVLLKYKHFKKYFYFNKSDKEILYLVSLRKYYFFQSEINGLMIPKQALKDIGLFKNDNDSKLNKLLWSLEASKNDYLLKGIIGTKLI